MDNSSTGENTGPDPLVERVETTQAVETAQVVETYEHRAIEAFYLDPYLVGLLAARPCEASRELPPPGMAFA
ncbi:MAG TPA: hypothetical protein VIS06_20270 [Mycobacteriales bacterium]|jgi:hypothetical protein